MGLRKEDKKRSEEGVNMVEYVLLVALIAVIALASVRFFGQRVSNQYSEIDAAMPLG